MCYSLLLSTTSNLNLAAHNTELVRFSRDLPAIPDVSQLKHAHQWYVGSRSGCSCSFRHLYSVELGFGEPVDWYKEEPADIEAPLQVVAIVRELLASGESVDCIDAWPRNEISPTTELIVGLGTLRDREFRFFENYHFVFTNVT
jgi:hypothetical protein